LENSSGHNQEGGKMKKSIPSIRNVVWSLIFLCSVVVWQPTLGFGATDTPGQANNLLSVGQIGSKAIDLKVWTEKPAAGTDNSEPLVVRLKTGAEAYMAAVYVSPSGEAIVLFPNKETPDSRALPGKEYTLLGPDSKLKLSVSDKTGRGKIAFYVSSKPLQLAPLKIPEGEVCVKIPASSAKDIETLVQKLEAMSQGEGFNRMVLELKTPAGKKVSLGLMGLPTEAKSGKPQPVTGVQGLKDKILESGKE